MKRFCWEEGGEETEERGGGERGEKVERGKGGRRGREDRGERGRGKEGKVGSIIPDICTLACVCASTLLEAICCHYCHLQKHCAGHHWTSSAAKRQCCPAPKQGPWGSSGSLSSGTGYSPALQCSSHVGAGVYCYC